MIENAIDYLSEMLDKLTDQTPEIVTPDVDSDVLDGSESDVDGEPDVADGLVATASLDNTVVSGNEDVDDLLNNGIDTSSDTTDIQEEKHYRSLLSFTGATKCNLCSCGHYQGADGMDALCVCGHSKWNHRWG